MPNTLVIVESPTKAKTLSRFLGSKYKIEASMGHIRDLPKAEIGVDIENNFEPKYIIPRDKTKRVNELKRQAKDADTIYLASDPDREGEAIAWHIAELLGQTKSEIKRVVFHEITEDAIKEAFKHPRDINLPLVNAQQARRILDRLVGYKLSPLLWKKIKRGLSAGRVQTVALRLIVEREREILIFKPVEHWTIEALLKSSNGQFSANLIEKDGKKLDIENEKSAKTHQQNLEKANFIIQKITKKEIKRQSAPPFITSTLQQTAGNRLGYTAKRTMMLAQNLYEQGLITYMRTDSVNLSTFALNAARDLISKQFGQSYLPPSPKVFKTKSKNAQEAHEAIRPSDLNKTAQILAKHSTLTKDHLRLYDLIWKRTVASQMSEAIFDQTSVDIKADNYLFRATGSIIKFDGWLKLYGRTPEDDESKEEGEGKILPELTEKEVLKLIELIPNQHFSEPPPRYTESSLVKKLEELGIGRPSTYAPILSTIQERFYVERVERKFVPTILGFAVSDFLIKYFPDIFDYAFTASMEDELDDIALGERNWKETVKKFFSPLEQKLEKTLETADRVDLPVETVDRNCPVCGKQLIVRTGRFGKFLACSGFPDCKHTESLEEKLDVKCPDCGGDLVVRKTKKRRTFYGCKNYPNCKFASWTKPK